MNSIFSLESKTAVVTGAARGNGKAIANGLRDAGANVIGLDKLEAENCFMCDITNTNNIIDCLDGYDTIDVLVNNAGVSSPCDFLDYPEDDWDKTHEINVKAPFKMMQIVGEKMKNKGGSIINITSLNSEMAFPNNPAYVSSKGALKQLTKSAALDLGCYGIRANNVGPGYFKTEMTRGSWEDAQKNKIRF